MAASADPTPADLWARYKERADSPNWFTRWMLERTSAAVAHCVANASRPGATPATSQAALLAMEGALRSITVALAAEPLRPPEAVDSRVELMPLALPSDQCLAILDCLGSTPADSTLSQSNPGLPVDEVQARRKNPWGGFREAWLEHYNEVSGTANRGGEMADKQVCSEVAGTVWKVHVQAGDVVAQDQELMILESMKMEIPVEAPCAGTVASVLVVPEDGIEEDQVLLIIAS